MKTNPPTARRLAHLASAAFQSFLSMVLANQRGRLAVFLSVLTPMAGWASQLPVTTDQQIGASAAVFRGTVVQTQSYVDPADRMIYTRTVLRVEEVFKGKAPPLVALVEWGGAVQGRAAIEGETPQFAAGEERLVFVSRRPNGTLCANGGEPGAVLLSLAGSKTAGPELAAAARLLTELRGKTSAGPLAGEDVTDQAASVGPAPGAKSPRAQPQGSPASSATNFFSGSGNLAPRYLQPDRGEGIPYWIDADYLPSGITQAEAVGAVQTALAAWTNACSVRYQFGGIQSFGMAANAIPDQGGQLFIQLHNHYNAILTNSGDTLGIGGCTWLTSTTASGWTLGGNVAGNDFNQIVQGFVIIQNASSYFSGNVTNLEGVLCHEIGHSVCLAHSSNNSNETNTELTGSIMYAYSSGGRGATLNIWDTNTIRQAYPAGNTPPWCYSRVIDVVTSPGTITNPAVNTIRVPGYKLQSGNLSFLTADAWPDANHWSVAANGAITYLAGGWYEDSGRLDPVGDSFYGILYARYSDGVNFSPYASIKVVSLWSDKYSEGIPDTWRLTYFGSTDPSAKPKCHAWQDYDGDGFSNLTEWWLGSSPTDANSNLRITSFSPTNIQWQAKGYEVYEVQSSTDLVHWNRALNPIVPTNIVPGTNLFNLTNAIGVAAGFANGGAGQFFRVVKLP
ncbi:MAG: hypothetical protein ABSG04_16610 [Verrucomicrobiota bacterium]